jgi:hypothetical protein
MPSLPTFLENCQFYLHCFCIWLLLCIRFVAQSSVVEEESRALEGWQADIADHVGKAGRAVPAETDRQR